ncbi:MAG: hypothetical protein CSA18_04410 [Deltaproteobacteria bacterium]|nr:MAG: hypothetical protein CSA18_04410 [Deltaproteobacteria bacterium]
MDPAKIIQQMIDFQKAAFDNSYNAMVMFQSQTEKIAESIMAKNTMLPEENQKMINEWLTALKKGREDFKKSIDENFTKMEDFCKSNLKETKTAKK